LAIERQRKARDLFTPESLIEVVSETLGLATRVGRLLMETQCVGKFSCRLPGSVNVSLNFTESYGSRYIGSIFMKDRVLCILPTLVNEAVCRSALILDKAIAVLIAELFDLPQRSVYIRPNVSDKRQITGPFVVRAG
jgi:hypothetical protein